ncbi:Protein tweety-like protein 3 [Acropora cervicornis]|uniref:Protein tweety homolog n=1 Tax=Acropora cervicornis TaxID=6130 RepID=A0AAD9VEY4_ACRCE|nr:Protein tweety-like protein 3 [Acropora cervicornis]
MAVANCSAGVFNNPPSIAHFFHSFSHPNFSFDNVSSIFIPTFPDYQQALFLYAIGPCIFGGLVFLIFCVYYVTSCCFSYKLHRARTKCAVALRCIVLLMSVLSSGSVIVAFVFNDSVRQGVKGVMTAVGKVNNTLVDTQTKTCDDVTDHDRFLIRSLRGYIDDIIVLVVRIKKVNLPPVEEYVQEIEYYRGMIVGTVSVLLIWLSVGVDLALSVVSYRNMILHTKIRLLALHKSDNIFLKYKGIHCILQVLKLFQQNNNDNYLCTTACCAVFWSFVAMSDLCEQPKETLYHYIKDQPALKGIVMYYVECPVGESNPDQKYADKAENYQEKVENCHSLLNNTKANIAGIIKNLDCKFPHQLNFNKFRHSGTVQITINSSLSSLSVGI